MLGVWLALVGAAAYDSACLCLTTVEFSTLSNAIFHPWLVSSFQRFTQSNPQRLRRLPEDYSVTGQC